MKSETIKIGVSDPKFHVTVNTDEAETVQDCLKLSKDSEAYLATCFMRGHRIKLQDSEARETVQDLVKGKTTAELADPKFVTKVTAAVQTLVNAFDPLAPVSRGGRPAKEVVVETTKASYSPAEMQELLRAAGAKVTFVTKPKDSK